MKTRSMLALAIIAGLITVSVSAEQKKLYRVVDKDGKVQYVDQLPPEAVNQARKEINSKGIATSNVDRALTEAERNAQAEQVTATAEAQKIADQQKRIENAMLINYATEEDLHRTYKERIDLLQQTIESTDISIKSIRGSLTGMLAQASESELANRPVDPARAKQIQDMHHELLKQQVAQIGSRNDVKAMQDEFNAVLARYRELRSAGATPTDVSAPVATPGAAPPLPAAGPANQ